MLRKIIFYTLQLLFVTSVYAQENPQDKSALVIKTESFENKLENLLNVEFELNKDEGHLIVDDSLRMCYYYRLSKKYYELGNAPKSIAYGFKCLSLLPQFNEIEIKVQVFMHIADMYGVIGDYEQSKIYFDQCIMFIAEIPESERNEYYSWVYNGAALDLYIPSGQYEKSLYYVYGSITNCKELGETDFRWNYYCLIKAYTALHQYDSANFYIDKILSTQYAKNFYDLRSLAFHYAGIAESYRIQNKPLEATELLLQAIHIADSLTLIEPQLSASKQLYQTYKERSNFSKAMYYLEYYHKIYSNIYNAEQQRKSVGGFLNYEAEKDEIKRNAEAELKELALEADKKQQTIIGISLAFGLIALTIFLLINRKRLRVTRQQKGIIEFQKKEVDNAYTHLQEKNNEILQSIAYAKRIQSAILPPDKLIKQYLPQSFVLFKPKDVVAGDFYWLQEVEGQIFFAACDCTGHGVPGAMVSVICNNCLNRSVREFELREVGQILDKTRALVIQEFEKSEEEVKDGMDVAICSIKGNILQYAGAHNPLWLLRKGAKEVEEIKADKQPIGKFEQYTNYSTHQLTLNEGDSIYLFSDGYVDQFGGIRNKKFKSINFKKLLISIQHESMTKQKELLDEAFEAWKGEYEQVDDVCIIGYRA